MSFHVICMTFILAVGIHLGNAQLAGPRCDALPKLPFDVKAIQKFDLLEFHFSINSNFECAYDVNIGPLPGKRGIDGTKFVIKQSAVVAFDYIGAADNKSVDVVACASGEKFVYYAINHKITPTGGWYCLYNCEQNGIALRELFCAGTDKSFVKEESAAVAEARGVQNFDAIKDARLSCGAAQFCSLALN